MNDISEDIYFMIFTNYNLSIVDAWNLSLTCKCQRKIFNNLVIKIFKFHLLNRLKSKSKKLTIEKIFNNKHNGIYDGINYDVKDIVITGSTLWSILLNEEWENSDIDIFVGANIDKDKQFYGIYDSSISKFGKLLGYKLLNTFVDDSKIKNWKISSGVLMYESCVTKLINKSGEKLFDIVIHNINNLYQKINQFDIVGCSCYYNGKELYISNPKETLNKKSFINESLINPNRILKYMNRGIIFTNLSDYKDELKEYLKSIRYNKKYLQDISENFS